MARSKIRNRFDKIKKIIGPGIITGSSGNDPAGIVTYTTVGALFGYTLIWALIIITPLMIVVQEMAGRIAIIQKKGFAFIIKKNYGYKIAYISVFILVIANITTIAADLAGMASVLGLLTDIHFLYFIAPIALIISGIILFEDYKAIRKILISLSFLLILYIFSAIVAKPDWGIVVKSLLPNIQGSTLFLGALIGMIGTTISPYMLFWQAAEEIEEKHKVLHVQELEWDTIIGMGWSNIISAFIIIAAGSTLFIHNIQIENISDIAIALQPIAGNFAYGLFTIGIIVSGFLALPVLAGSTAYAISDIFDWKEGLSKKIHMAKGFYLTIILSMVVGTIVSFLPIEPVIFLYYTQILNGFLTPFLITILLILCNNKAIMGAKNVNGPIKNTIGILSVLLLITLDIFLVVGLV